MVKKQNCDIRVFKNRMVIMQINTAGKKQVIREASS